VASASAVRNLSPMASRFLRFPLFLLGSVLLVTGCAYQTPAAHIPASLPAVAPCSLDVTDVTVKDAKGPIDDETIAGVRRDTAAILMKAAKERGALAAPGPTVIHATVTLEERENFVENALSQDGIAIFGLWPVAFGMINGQQKLSVDVDVETNGHLFHGHGTAEKRGSIYAHARRRALAVALDRALADAATTQ
jgi:hypothetical protein